jgi:uncharacterized membrane protein
MVTWNAIKVAAAVGAGTAGGVFFAFSTFVMRAIDRLPPAQSVAAMQAMNKYAPNPLFMAALFGTAAASVGLIFHAVRSGDSDAGYLVAGGILYLSGIVLTIVYHIPHNEALDLVDANGPDAAGAWSRYAGPWTAWNHVRTLTSIGAAAAYCMALRTG